MTFHREQENVIQERKIEWSPAAFDCDRCETRLTDVHTTPEGWSTIRMPDRTLLHLCSACTNVLPALLQQHKHVHEVAETSVTDQTDLGLQFTDDAADTYYVKHNGGLFNKLTLNNYDSVEYYRSDSDKLAQIILNGRNL